jgi:hypothetical protein
MPKKIKDGLITLFKTAIENVNSTLFIDDKIIFDKNLIIKGDNCLIESLTIINLLLEIERLVAKNLKKKIEIFEMYQEYSGENLIIDKFITILNEVIENKF